MIVRKFIGGLLGLILSVPIIYPLVVLMPSESYASALTGGLVRGLVILGMVTLGVRIAIKTGKVDKDHN